MYFITVAPTSSDLLINKSFRLASSFEASFSWSLRLDFESDLVSSEQIYNIIINCFNESVYHVIIFFRFSYAFI